MAISVFPAAGASTDEGGTLVTSLNVVETGSKISVAVAPGNYSFTFYGTGTLNVYSNTASGVGSFLGFIESQTSGNADAVFTVGASVTGLAFSGATGTVVVRKFTDPVATSISDSNTIPANVGFSSNFQPFRVVKGGNRWVVTSGLAGNMANTWSAYSDDGITWISSQNMPFQGHWVDITHGNNLFVAVAGTSQSFNGTNYAALATSPNGITWTQRSTPVAGWTSIAFGNGTFVGVANGTTGMYSTDGVTWTASTLPANQNWVDVTFGNGLFVAISTSQTFASSTDGINWTSRTAASSGSWRRVHWTGTRFVVTGAYVSNTQVSTNGITWTNGTGLDGNSGWDYQNGDFVNGVIFANSGSRARIEYSTDEGVTWNFASTPSAQQYTSILWTGQQYVAICFTTATNSLIGQPWSWSTIGMPLGANGGMYYVNGRYVGINHGGSTIWSSTNGLSWTTHFLPFSAGWNSISFGNGIYVLTIGDASNGATASSSIYTSPDLTTWTQRTVPNLAYKRSLFGAGRFVLPASNSTTSQSAVHSTDGINWSSTNGQSSFSSVMAFGRGRFVALPQYANGTASTSTDGINWTVVDLPAGHNPAFTSVAFGNGIFVALASSWSTGGGPIYTSSDGVTWVRQPASTGITVATSAQMTFANGYFAFGWNNRVHFSTNGRSWSVVNVGADMTMTTGGPQGIIFANTNNGSYLKTGTTVTIS